MLTAEEARSLINYDPVTGEFRWRIDRGGPVRRGALAGTYNAAGYRQIMLKGKRYYAHRLAYLMTHGAWPGHEVDHANLDKSDNRISNLRLATRSQNRANTTVTKRNTTGFKGVYYRKREQRYVASIQVDGVTHCLGYFTTAMDAHAAYSSAAANLNGEFSRVK